MTKTRIALATALGVAAVILITQWPARTLAEPSAQKRATVPTATRDAATTLVTGNLAEDPGVAMLVGGRGSSSLGFRGRMLVACDQSVSVDLTGPGEHGLVGGGRTGVYVCSYSISNGRTAQDVQFIYGLAASAGGNKVCGPATAVTAKFHLAPNQFVSQGAGVGTLFQAPPGQGLCFKVSGEVSVNVTYASF